jgi:hypothetical protein
MANFDVFSTSLPRPVKTNFFPRRKSINHLFNPSGIRTYYNSIDRISLTIKVVN